MKPRFPQPRTYREHALSFIAAYDQSDAGAYERELVRIARSWLKLIETRRPVQGIVNRLADELYQPVPDGYGCGWDDLKQKFTAWALGEEWLDTATVARLRERA